MNIALWIVQILLTVIFFFHGWLMWTTPQSVQQTMAYILAIPSGFRRFIGTAEFLAGAGLIVPALTGILTWLTPLAATGLIIVMAGAVIDHIQRKEYPNLGLNLVLLVMAIFVAYGRFVVIPL